MPAPMEHKSPAMGAISSTRVKTHPRDDADNFAHHPTFVVVADINADAFTDRIFAGKILFGHRLIDDDDARRIFCVALVKRAAAQQRHLECLKSNRRRRLRDRCSTCPKVAAAPFSSRQNPVCQPPMSGPFELIGRVLHTGNRAHFVEQALCECVDLLAIDYNFATATRNAR